MSSSVIKSQDGGVLIVLLALLPFILSAGIFVTGLFFVLKTHGAALHLCRTELIQLQEERLNIIDRLMAMNKYARGLRLARDVADKALKAAIATGVAPLIATARAKVFAAQTAQVVFRGRQETHRLDGILKTRHGFYRLQEKLRRLHTKHGRLYRNQNESVVTNFRTRSNFLAVEPKQKRELTPDFVRVKAFEREEYLQLSWKLHVLRLLPKWMRLETTIGHDLTIDVSCAASVENKGGKKWRARLAADKRFLSLW